MKDNINNKERMNETAQIFRLNSVSEFFEPSIQEAKVFEEINYIAQTIHYFIGGFQTEKTYQNAFEQELISRADQFSYFREFSMDIVYRGAKVGFAVPDFVVIPDRKYFNLKDKLPAFFVEIKQKNKIDEDVSTDIIRDFEEKSNINKTGSRSTRQQLWKYLNSASYSTNDSIKKIDTGVIINFSTELETTVNPTPILRDEMGAYLEIWQIINDPKKNFFNDNADGENEMHLILESVLIPMTRKDLKKYNRENFEEAQKFNEEEFRKGNF